MTEKLFDVDGIRILAFKLSCEDQFRLATFIAENVGYVLAPEPRFEDGPTLEDRLVKLEKTVAHLCPDKSDDV
jgi:hypothetical protein